MNRKRLARAKRRKPYRDRVGFSPPLRPKIARVNVKRPPRGRPTHRGGHDTGPPSSLSTRGSRAATSTGRHVPSFQMGHAVGSLVCSYKRRILRLRFNKWKETAEIDIQYHKEYSKPTFSYLVRL